MNVRPNDIVIDVMDLTPGRRLGVVTEVHGNGTASVEWRRLGRRTFAVGRPTGELRVVDRPGDPDPDAANIMAVLMASADPADGAALLAAAQAYEAIRWHRARQVVESRGVAALIAGEGDVVGLPAIGRA